MKIGKKEFDILNETYIMGILNVTPDSFSDGGKYDKPESALMRAKQMQEEGASIIDIGGESTRPGFTPVSTQEEIERVTPVIEKIKANLDVPVSIDTYKSEVAIAAVEAGADMINDVWGFRYDKKMAEVAAKYHLPCVLVHNRDHTNYNHFMKEVFNEMRESIRIAKEAGVDEETMILDPGIGFGKTYEMNLELLKYLEDFHQFGYPMMLAASRKSVIGAALGLPVDERVEGTMVTTVMAVMKRYAFVRVHDIKENLRAIQMTKAILESKIFEFDKLCKEE